MVTAVLVVWQLASQLHLTFNGGSIEVSSADDPINASEDGVSAITINDGIINCSVQNGEEGDGIDSNGYIYINGGSVLAQSHANSMDSGLDADLGIIINSGVVCATGNMYEEISEKSAQQYAQFYFAEKQKGGVPLVVTDAEGNYVLAYTPVNDFSILEFSLPDMVDGATYHLYSGGTITGTITNGIYTEVINYEDGTQMGHRGIMQGGGRPDFGGQLPKSFEPSNIGRPQGMTPPTDGEQPQKRPNGQRPQGNNGETPQMPENFDPNNLPERFGGFGGSFDANIPLIADFVIDSENRVYAGIAAMQ